LSIRRGTRCPTDVQQERFSSLIQKGCLSWLRTIPVNGSRTLTIVDRPRKNHPLEITLGYDEDGVVSRAARDPDTGREIKRDFTDSVHPMDRILAQKVLLDSVDLCE
jgi:hypothetical protein